jgi:hypothetical protein
MKMQLAKDRVVAINQQRNKRPSALTGKLISTLFSRAASSTIWGKQEYRLKHSISDRRSTQS